MPETIRELQLWAARDNDGSLMLWDCIPRWAEAAGIWVDVDEEQGYTKSMYLPEGILPEILPGTYAQVKISLDI